MADTAVHMFLDNLVQLMASDHDWILPVKYILLSLHGDIASMSKYLKETEDKRLENPKVNNLVMEIRDAAVEAENIIDSFVVDAMTVGVTPDLSSQLESVKKEIKAIKAEMNDTSETVSLDQQVDHIIRSFDNGKNLEVISVVGFPGIGKTTLAREIHNDTRVKEHFPIRAWVAVSQKYERRGLLVDILKSSSLFEEKDTNLPFDNLAEQLWKRLKGKRYLIVMDDIWSVDAWDSVKRSFPSEKNGSKVMLTSRQAQVGKAAATYSSSSDKCNTHYVYGLSEEKSWELFQSKVFRNQPNFFPKDLEEIGRRIVKKCAGVPFSIVLVGGYLSKEKNRPEIWNQVAESLNSSLSSIAEAYMSTLELSYGDLPFHLKACVLYLGLFPEDYEIHVRKIMWLIIAEGFAVQDRSDNHQVRSLEDIAQGYLDDLAERSLLILSKKRWDGAAKSYHIHDLLHDFCRVKGKQENFISEMFDDRQLSLSTHDKNRRLFMSDRAYQKASLKPYARRLRSLVCFGSNLDTDSAFDENDYKYLKVLDLLSLRIPFPNDIGKLIHLKYLALSILSENNRIPESISNCIPESISNLFSLETLILLGTSDITMLLPSSFWKMRNLRHLYSKALIFHFCPDSNSTLLVNLQTLHQLCACHSCVKMLERTPGIRKLGMRGNPVLSPSGGVSIPDFSCLKQLQSLKIVNTGFCPPTSSNIVNLSTLPASLKRLTLTKTFLKWEEILVLGNLGNLEVLKLLDDACVVSDQTSEPDWDTSDQDFSKLKYLKMRKLKIAKWVDSDVSGFQRLEVLVLEECPRLEMLPLALAQLSSLTIIKVTKCNSSLETCAKEIQTEHEKESGDKNLRVEIVS